MTLYEKLYKSLKEEFAKDSLKPISKQAKKLLEKIIANQELYPVSMKINKAKNTITIRYDSSTPASFSEFVLLVKEFSYGKEYYPIQEIYFDDQGIIGNIELVPTGYSFIMITKEEYDLLKEGDNIPYLYNTKTKSIFQELVGE